MQILTQEPPMPPHDPRDQPVSTRPAITYEATPESVAHAKAMAAQERAEVDAEIRRFDLRQLEAVLAVRDLVAEWGPARVIAWVRNAPELGE